MIKTLVLGASMKPYRYSHMCIEQLEKHGFPAVGVGLREGVIGHTPIYAGQPDLEDIHTITMYMNEDRQKAYYDYIFSLSPRRIIFNPGAENHELAVLARQKGIETINACTLVMLNTWQYLTADEWSKEESPVRRDGTGA